MMVYTGSIIPIIATGAPMPVMSERVRKKQPIGTPALPIAETTESRSQRSIVARVSSMPPFCITKSEVTRMNAAQPFMLIVVQMGNTKRATLELTPSRLSAVSIVTGNVAAELLVNSAMSTAGVILPSVRSGLMPRERRKRGRTMKNF